MTVDPISIGKNEDFRTFLASKNILRTSTEVYSDYDSLFSSTDDELKYEKREYCLHTKFEANCPLGEVLVFRRAVYGRMRVGQCVRTNFGFVGCSVDVLDVVDARCSGHATCQFDVVEPTFKNRRPCNVELKNYLEVEYACVRGT